MSKSTETLRKPLNRSGYFLDSGSIEQIQKWKEIIGGVTTNQVILFSKEGVTNIPEHLDAMCEATGPGIPISLELPDSSWSVEKMVALAEYYYHNHPDNTVIKVPILPKDVKGLKIITILSKNGIPTNATIGMSFGQLTMAAEAARTYAGQGSTYISLFWGRTQECVERYKEGVPPQQLLEATLAYLINHQLNDTRIIVGSIREPVQVIEAFSLGADIVTVPPSILESLLYNRRADETVEEFNSAFRAVENTITLN